jgi:alpha-glucosidase (family GH31 glycosyl hydrolase)
VYFPATNNWYDFYTGEKVKAGQTLKVPTSENSIPTYVRAGAFILMTDVVQTTEDYDGSNLELHYYHENGILKSEREYYNDDGKTPDAFEKGRYEILEFETEIDKKWIEIDFEAENGNNYQFSKKMVKLVVHNIDWQPRIVRINGRKAGLNQIGNTLVIPVNWNTSKEAKIKISLEAK